MLRRADETPEVIDNLRRIFQAINEYSKVAKQVTGLTGPQLCAVKILANAAPLRVSALAAKMYLKPATIVGILDLLEGKGIVTRTRSEEDHRVVNLHLTDKGQGLAAKAPEVTQAMLLKGLETLSDEQFSCVEKGMKLMVQMLGAENCTPQPLQS